MLVKQGKWEESGSKRPLSIIENYITLLNITKCTKFKSEKRQDEEPSFPTHKN